MNTLATSRGVEKARAWGGGVWPRLLLGALSVNPFAQKLRNLGAILQSA